MIIIIIKKLIKIYIKMEKILMNLVITITVKIEKK